MLRYIGSRMIQLVIVLLGVTFLTFFVTTLTPSDAAEMYYYSNGIVPSEEQLAQTRHEFGLDRPFIVRYADWFGGVLRGDFGESLMDSESIMTKYLRKLPNTLKLTGTTLAVVVSLSLPLGAAAAVFSDRLPDNVLRLITFLGVAMPGFWTALLVMYFFGVVLRVLPVIGTGDLKSMAMPVISLAIPMTCSYTRQVRTAVLEELSGDYVTGLRSRGVSEASVIFRHVMPNAMVPIVNMLGLSLGGMLGGSTIVESIYNWKGIGSMVVGSITNRDYPTIQCYVLWMSIIYVTANLLVDILHYLMDPQLRIKELSR
ncbi:MAG: ABC transporter permease [Firmicutes bacterium]|nr:ABC transporter permease [Bacillota bacterium]MBR0114568.1 ABC transporter permease [Bacillota bacterium]MBR0441661.1 ABC transporter permease [Bacillota bacterium]